jgi:hypothetical protein
MNTIEKLKESNEQAAREIYYAMTFLQKNHPALANLKLALSYLEVRHPKEVGLSDRVLTMDNWSSVSSQEE